MISAFTILLFFRTKPSRRLSPATKCALPEKRPRPTSAALLAADTAVILGDTIFGKPVDRNEEIRFLKALSGMTHTVRTALVVATSPTDMSEAVSVSHVHFRRLTDEEIAWYSATEEPYDKAGGYAVQGLAAAYIDRIEGSYSGIMGLAAYETAALLKTLNIIPTEK